MRKGILVTLALHIGGLLIGRSLNVIISSIDKWCNLYGTVPPGFSYKLSKETAAGKVENCYMARTTLKNRDEECAKTVVGGTPALEKKTNRT